MECTDANEQNRKNQCLDLRDEVKKFRLNGMIQLYANPESKVISKCIYDKNSKSATSS